MRYLEWEPIYLQILRDFGYELSEDERAAGILSEMVSYELRIDDPEEYLERIIADKTAAIIGPCDFSDDLIERLSSGIDRKDLIISSAGDGTRHALEVDLVPDFVFTDLDGLPELDILANKKGAIAVIHAHGDNIEALRQWVPEFKGKVIPTCQCAPFPDIFNWGGFTDGDRAFCLLSHFGASSISLLGFDFHVPCGSKFNGDNEIKKKKLSWAERIIEKALMMKTRENSDP